MKKSVMSDKIANILGSNARFFIMEGDQENIAKEVISFFDSQFEFTLFEINGKEFKAENARSLVAELTKKSFKKNIYLFYDFEQIDSVPQNILLKSLEELGESKIVIGLCDSIAGILDTVISRSCHVFLHENKNGNEKPSAFEPNNSGRLDDLTRCYQFLEENEVTDGYSFLYGISQLDDIKRKNQINSLILEYTRRIEANGNRDLCADLLIYKILEERWA